MQMILRFMKGGPLHTDSKFVEELKAWMALNVLNFNEKRTGVIHLSPGITSGSPPVDMCSLGKYVKSTVTHLRFRMDGDFKLVSSVQVKSNITR